MNDELAIAQLKALLKVPGALRVITAERSKVAEKELQARGGNPLADPRAYVVHDVVRVEEVKDGQLAGLWVASTNEGDMTMGEPAALLARLLEASRG